jgi:hypothetical protein
MRLAMIAAAGVLLLIPATPASAVRAPGVATSQATDFSAAKRKKAKKTKAPKVEYMRAVPVR